MSYNSELQSNNSFIQTLINVVNELPEATNGVELPTLSSPADASEVFSGKQTIDQNGEIQTGTFTIDGEISSQEDLIEQIKNAANTLPNKGEDNSEKVCPSLTITGEGGVIFGYVIYPTSNPPSYNKIDQHQDNKNFTLTSIPCNSAVIVKFYRTFNVSFTTTNAEVLYLDMYENYALIKCTSTSEARIVFTEYD